MRALHAGVVRIYRGQSHGDSLVKGAGTEESAGPERCIGRFVAHDRSQKVRAALCRAYEYAGRSEASTAIGAGR